MNLSGMKGWEEGRTILYPGDRFDILRSVTTNSSHSSEGFVGAVSLNSGTDLSIPLLSLDYTVSSFEPQVELSGTLEVIWVSTSLCDRQSVAMSPSRFLSVNLG